MFWNREALQRLIDKACYLGLQREVCEFPLKLEELEKLELPRGPRPPFYKVEKRGEIGLRYPDMALECLFSPGVFLLDRNGDGLSDDLNFYFALPEKVDDSLAGALADLCCRFAMDVTALDSSGLLVPGEGKACIRFLASGEAGLEWREEAAKVELRIQGQGSSLREFISKLCNRFDHAWQKMPLEELSWQLREAFAARNYDGQKALILQKGPSFRYLTDLAPGQESGFPSTYRIERRKEPLTVLEEEYRGYSESEELFKILEACAEKEAVLRIEAALSKDRPEREALAKRTQALFPQAEIEILNAYKPGFSWLEEHCLPRLKGLQAQELLLRFKPCLKEGESDWGDEDGAVPKRAAASIQKEEGKWLELPLRFLQELYPADEILAWELGIPLDHIRFEADPELKSTYELSAYRGERELFRETYQVRTRERFYLDAFPEAGLVHPAASYVRITNREGARETLFACDRDWIWEQFQEKILPALKSWLDQRYPEGLKEEDQPFFARLTLEAWLSETERDLPFRQDMIAPLDALQEDFYFTSLDYFKHLGRVQGGKILSAPGLIYPDLHLRKGPPCLRLRLEEEKSAQPLILQGEEPVCSMNRSEGCAPLRLTRLSLFAGRLCYGYETDSIDRAYLESFSSLLREGKLSLCESLPEDFCFAFDDAAPSCCCWSEPEKDLDIRDLDIAEKEVIDDRRMAEIAASLKRVRGVEVLRLAESYMGRPVYGLRLQMPALKGYVSRTRELSLKPSVILNCRHHANEVSSTTSSLLLLRTLLTDAEFSDLGQKLRLIIIPMENPDGAAIHALLSRKHPRHKLHVARFNALGYEFAYDNFKADTIHREAHATLRLFKEYLPDVIIDDHGVPTHEWEQPYSGYTSPAFKGFWLPRSILYGYFWYPEGVGYEAQLALCQAVQKAVCRAVSQDAELSELNAVWQERFEKYAHRFMPKLFPADYQDGMIHYWIGKKPSADNLYTSQRWPWVNSCYYTSEVADETAQGSYLALCARTHLLEDLAILRFLLSTERHITVINAWQKGGLCGVFERKRPVLPSQRFTEPNEPGIK